MIEKRVKLSQALQEAQRVFNRGEDLPAYLEKALIRFEDAFWKSVDRRVLAPKLVSDAHKSGRPLAKVTTKGAGAFEVVALRLDVSMSTVERAYSDFPPDPDGAAVKRRKPAIASKKTAPPKPKKPHSPTRK